jgi:hypothetical protein
MGMKQRRQSRAEIRAAIDEKIVELRATGATPAALKKLLADWILQMFPDNKFLKIAMTILMEIVF